MELFRTDRPALGAGFAPKKDRYRGVGGVMSASPGADTHAIAVIPDVTDDIPRVGQSLPITLLDRQTIAVPIGGQLDAVTGKVVTGPEQKPLNVIGRCRKEETAVIE